MSQIKRTYLIAYSWPGGTGRFFNERETDDAPTRENIESMERQVGAQHGSANVVTTGVFLIATAKGATVSPQEQTP